MHAEIIIPLFPLGVVLMPQMPLPLHIFEERYKVMIGECLEKDKEFGVVYFSGKELSKVGCTAKIVDVLKQYDTGEMDIVTVGNSRFFIKDIYNSKPYAEASVVYFDDQVEEEFENFIELARQGIESLKALDRMAGVIIDYGTPEELGLKRISFLIAGIDGFTPAEKQKFLEMTSTKNRLESGVKSLSTVLKRAMLTQEIREIISGNGNIEKILREI